jgi:hypothetical protein
MLLAALVLLVLVVVQIKAAKYLCPAQSLPVIFWGNPVQFAHLAGNPHP